MQIAEGTVGVVTGAGSGIGKGIALALATRGMRVVLADVSEERVSEAAAEVEAATGADVLAVVADVADPASVERLARYTFDEFGIPAVLCNNAGTLTVGPVWETSLSDWSHVLGVNLMGAVHGIKSFVPHMITSGTPAHVVNTSSMAGLIPMLLHAAYTASKHAVVGLSRALEAELISINAPIGVSVVCPGPTRTAIIDDEIARHGDGSLASSTQAVLDGLKAALDVGMTPNEAGELIARSIELDRFWVLPNAEDHFGPAEDEWKRLQACRGPA